jgi:autotransporter-associated beta strand protein
MIAPARLGSCLPPETFRLSAPAAVAPYVIGATRGTLIGTGIQSYATTALGFTFNNACTNGGLFQINAIVTGSAKTLTKTGSGTVILSGANTFTRATTISAGTLKVATSSGSALGTTSAITVNSGGTLLLGASNQINDTAPITLAGGTFAKGDFSEGSTSTAGAGALTLSVTGSHLDFGTGTGGTLTFASFSPGSFSLTIDNWRAAGTDRLVFDSNQSGNLSHFNFTGYAAGAFEIDLGGGYYEITPVAPIPEASTYVAGALALGALAYHQRRRFRRRRIRRWLPER